MKTVCVDICQPIDSHVSESKELISSGFLCTGQCGTDETACMVYQKGETPEEEKEIKAKHQALLENKLRNFIHGCS